MDKGSCPNFERGCSAPLCPLDEVSIEHGIWYPDEEICKGKDFQTLDWIKNQRAVAKAKAPADKYFTVEMLEAVKQVRRGIEGINPDQPLDRAREAERKWISEKKSGRVIARKTKKPGRVVAEKRQRLALATSTSHQEKGGKNDV